MADAIVEIGRLHARVDRDSPALRAAVEARVTAAELRPAELPPAAILIVRRAEVAAQLRPWPTGADRPWELACRDALSAAARAAARPDRGRLPDGAAAVLFRDEAELLACLALDLAGGVAARRWWWRFVRVRSSVAQQLAERPAAVPAAIAELCSWQRIERVAAALGDGGAAAVLRVVADVYGAPAVAAVADVPVAEAPSWLPAPAAVPEPRARMLVGIALLAHARPEIVRGRAFADALAVWTAAPGRQAPPVPGRTGNAVRDVPADGKVAAPSARAVVSPVDTPADVTAPAGAPAGRVASGGVAPEGSVSGEPASASPVTGPVPAPASHAAAADEGPAASAAETPGAPAAPSLIAPGVAPPASLAEPASVLVPEPSLELPAAVPAPPDGGVATRLAGVFQLLNVMRRLGLPEVFEAHWRLASGLGAWGTLEALARGLLPAEDDPLWEILAGLAGREPGAPLGERVSEDAPYALPPAWWPELGVTGAVQRGARGDRVRIWAGDVLVVEGEHAGTRQLRPYGLARTPLRSAEFGSAPLAPAPDVAPGLEAWLSRVIPAVRRWCAVQLGVRVDRVAETLLVRPGVIHVTRMHVDVVMPLDSIELPVRRALLDADPGWDPALGRIVQLHFGDAT